MNPAAVVAEKVQQHQLVVAEHRMKPGLLDQRERAQRIGPSVDQVTDRKDAIPRGVEAVPLELRSSRARCPWRSPTTRSLPFALPASRWQRLILEILATISPNECAVRSCRDQPPAQPGPIDSNGPALQLRVNAGRDVSRQRNVLAPDLEDQVERRLGGAPEVRESGLAEHLRQARLPGLRAEHELAAFGDGVRAADRATRPA